ncbi:MAG: hypothetical protein QUS08_04605 [Methanothrix sp.]|nr:hypothetical protein [Methanothrix sp.]
MITALLILSALIGAADDSTDPAYTGLMDWLGTGPVYSYSTYYPHFIPSAYSARPAWFPYMRWPVSFWDGKHYVYPWWVGEHSDLPRVLEIARYSSSLRVYRNGIWQAP